MVTPGYRISARGSSEVEILLYGDIGEAFFGGVSPKQFADDLKAAGSVQTINIRINSMGGSVFDGLAIYRLLVEHPARVNAFVDGIAASIASVIAMAGNEIAISESGFMMIHNASGIVMGTSAEMREMADTLDTITNSIADVYVKRTKKKANEIGQMMTAETWLTAREAIDAGFADSMMENMRVAAHFDPTKHKFRHAPAALAGRPNYEAAAREVSRLKARLAQHRIKEFRPA